MDTLERDEKKSQTLKGARSSNLRDFTILHLSRCWILYVQLVPQILGGEMNGKS
jgi:hypothetical protein